MCLQTSQNIFRADKMQFCWIWSNQISLRETELSQTAGGQCRSGKMWEAVSESRREKKKHVLKT